MPQLIDNKVICVTLYNRPRQTKEFFWHLLRCRGLDEYTVFIHLDGAKNAVFNDVKEPAFLEVETLAKDFKNAEVAKKVHIITEPCGINLGIDASKMLLLEKAYFISDYVILMEDDTYPTVDTLNYMQTAFEWEHQNPNLVAVCAYNYHNKEDKLEKYKQTIFSSYEPFHWFSPWVWGMTYPKWNEIFSTYRNDPKSTNNRFDTIICDYMKVHPKVYSVRPPLSHVALIDAAEGATHTPSQEWFEENEKTWIHRGML